MPGLRGSGTPGAIWPGSPGTPPDAPPGGAPSGDPPPAPPAASAAVSVDAAALVPAEPPQLESLVPQSTPAAVSASPLQLKARGASWVEVVDGRDQILLARTLAAGEVVAQ